MKQSDVFTLILIAGIGTVVSFVLCNLLMGDPNEKKVTFTKLDTVITNDLVEPNEEVFNSIAINPTIEVYVGDCVDIDQNGMLDMAELIACGKEEAPEDEGGEDEEGETEEE